MAQKVVEYTVEGEGSQQGFRVTSEIVADGRVQIMIDLMGSSLQPAVVFLGRGQEFPIDHRDGPTDVIGQLRRDDSDQIIYFNGHMHKHKVGKFYFRNAPLIHFDLI